jgi:hypothetical protein
MKRLLAAIAAPALFSLGACALVAPPPAITNASLAPNVISPGQPVSVSYQIDYKGSWRDIQRVEILGFPENTIAAQTPTSLPVPPAPLAIAQTAVTVQAPAADGTYPMSLRVTYRNGQSVNVGLGNLQIQDMPTRFELAQFEPGSHNVAQCDGVSVRRDFKYAIADDNGANDLTNPQLSVVGTQPFAVSAPPVSILTGPINAPNKVIVAPPPGVSAAVMPSTSNLVLARTDAAAPTTFQSSVTLNAPQNANSTPEVVTTPLLVSCSVPAPMQWHLTLSGTNLAAYNQASVLVPGKPVEYVSAR